MADVPQLLTLSEVAERLRLSSHTIRAMVRRGRLTPVRICRRLLFSADDLLHLLAEAKATPSGRPAQGSQSSPTQCGQCSHSFIGEQGANTEGKNGTD
jgi:excisionase family DNA binding protein